MNIRGWIVGLLAVLGMSAMTRAAVLYDGSTNTLPGTQGWTYLTTPLGGASATQNAAGGVTTLDTTPASSDSAGYFSTFYPSFPTLSSNPGFTIRINLRVVSESRTDTADKTPTDGIDDRAGFSVIVLPSNHIGVELAFWSNEVWAQSTAFLHGNSERATFNTTSSAHNYDISVFGSSYEVYADGNLLFGGPLHDYYNGGVGGPLLPYGQNNFVFFGDDTSSGAGSTEIARVEYTASPVPEPSSLILLAAAAGLLIRRRPA